MSEDEPIEGVVVSHPIPGPPMFGFDPASDGPPLVGRLHNGKITLHHWGGDFEDTDEGQPPSSAHFVVSNAKVKRLPDDPWENIGFTSGGLR